LLPISISLTASPLLPLLPLLLLLLQRKN